MHKLKNTQSAAPLFADWEETIIWSCLEGVMGKLYADDTGHPESAMAVLGDFCFLGGKASEELLRYHPPHWNQDVMIMIPQSEEWAEMIERVYKGNAHKVERYAIKKEKDVFNVEKLHKIVEALPENCTLQFVDEELYHRCKEEDWSKDLVSQFPTYEEYKKMGIGVVLLVANQLAAGASSYSVYSQGIEIEIDTKEEYRRRGYATLGIGTAMMKRMLEELRKRGYHKASLAVQKANYAVKMYKNVGFEIVDENEEEYIMVCDLHIEKAFL